MSGAPEEDRTLERMRRWLDRLDPIQESAPRPVVRLAGDGSTRRLYRTRFRGGDAVAVANPMPEGRTRPDENDAFVSVRVHLEKKGIDVPALLASDVENGLFVLEDLGDRRLYEAARASGFSGGVCADLYRRAIRVLVRMQAPGEPEFDPESTSHPAYTESFVIEHEARYFHDEVVRGLWGGSFDFAEIEPECRRIAADALVGSPRVFMHRDYQSRNLMLLGERMVVIDFQGARPGPPEYDLAALIHDPYVQLPAALVEESILFYLAEAKQAGIPGITASGTAAWRRRFDASSANRLMQALGAFAKLGGRMGRPGFLDAIPAALGSLESILERRGDAPRLMRTVADLRRSFG